MRSAFTDVPLLFFRARDRYGWRVSTKRPDVIRTPPCPEKGLTLAHMHLQGWAMMGSCRRCSLRLRVSIPALIRVHGPDAIWWGRSARCPGWECDGQLVYSARSINGGTFTNVTAAAVRKEQLDAWKASRDQVDLGPR